MTDERQGERLWRALDALPRGAGIVFRHYRLKPAERRAPVRCACGRSRGGAGWCCCSPDRPLLARAWGADGSHGPGRGHGLHSASAHDLAEIRRAERAGADLLFLSPVYATRSHPGREAARAGAVRLAGKGGAECR